MHIKENTKEYQILKEFLAGDEKPSIEIIEHRLGGGWMLAPAHVYATRDRIVIIRAHMVGIYRKVKVIKYDKVSEIRLDRGMHFYKLHFGIIGEAQETDDKRAWIYGLTHQDAMELVHFLNNMNVKVPIEQEN